VAQFWHQPVQRKSPADAIEPLRKATELDPKSAQAWYLLGASLLMKMTTKKVGDREEVQLAPGTVEAYQKAKNSIRTGRGVSRPSRA